MDEAMLKSGQYPNVAIEAGTDPAEVMREHGQVIQNGEKYELADTSPAQVIQNGEKYKLADTDPADVMREYGLEGYGGWVEYCMKRGDSLGEALLHADEMRQAEKAESIARITKQEVDKQADTREQLEADVRESYETGMPIKAKVLDWLDRQSTITERELCGRCSPYATAKDYLDTIDSLTAERDHFRKHVNHLMALIADIARKQPYTFDPEAPYMTLDTIGDYLDELQDRVDSLTAERDQLSRDLEAEHAMVVQFEYDNEVLKTKLDIAEFQRDELGENWIS